MSATTIAYHLRPNKTIERDIFLDLLGTLSPVLPLSRYRYVGFGGPFLEDFRLVHKRIGLDSLVCIERDKDTHARQEFNRASPKIECRLGECSDVISTLSLEEQPAIVWFDYSDSRGQSDKIQSFADLVALCPVESIVRVTLNAEIPHATGDSVGTRRDRVRIRLGKFCPPDIVDGELTSRDFGLVLLRAIRVALSLSKVPGGLEFFGVSSFLYADGAPMLTVTGILLPSGGRDSFVGKTHIDLWEHFNENWVHPERIEVPVLSLLEQREIGLHGLEAAASNIGFALPTGKLVEDTLQSYGRYARIYPHFARVEV